MGIAISILPKVLQPIEPEIVEESLGLTLSTGMNRQLISDLQLLTPQYYKSYLEKYGNDNFTWWLSTYGESET